MLKYGFIEVAAVSPIFNLCDPMGNSEIYSSIIQELKPTTSLVVFPELSITGYTAQDFFQNTALLDSSLEACQKIIKSSIGRIVIIGIPYRLGNNLYNCALVISDGRPLAIVPKTYLPNYREFYEARWFTGYTGENQKVTLFGQEILFGNRVIFQDTKTPFAAFGVEICEDLWTPSPPSSSLSLNGANIICNLSASNASAGKSEYRRVLVSSQSARTVSGYVFVSSGISESTKDVVFDGHTIIAENGSIISEGVRFSKTHSIVYGQIDVEKINSERMRMNTFSSENSYERVGFQLNYPNIELQRKISRLPFVPNDPAEIDERCEEILNIQTGGLYGRLKSSGFPKSVVGVSGGLDSTLALLITLRAYRENNIPPENVIAVTLPGFGTTDKTRNNAIKLASLVGATIHEMPISKLSSEVFKTIKHDENNHSTVYENVQARMRTLILFSIANQHNALLIGTGDLSESALGWCTYNGDHISSYNVNCSIPKTLIRFLIEQIAKNEYSQDVRALLTEILNQPVSPELLPPKDGKIAQETEKIIGSYELHDFFLYYFVRFGFSAEKILYLAKIAFSGYFDEQEIRRVFEIFIKRFTQNQWKRDCVPGGPKVGSVDLSPRGSWRMPSEININSNFIDF